MEKFVRGFITQSDLDKAHEGLDIGIGAVKKLSTSLNDNQRIGLRTMAEGREGMARTVARIAVTHTDCLPRNEKPEEMEAAFAYYDKLAVLLQKTAFFHEIIDDTITAVGADIMAMVDRYAGFLRVARTGNTNLDMALDQLDKYNRRFANKPAVQEPAPATPVS